MRGRRIFRVAFSSSYDYYLVFINRLLISITCCEWRYLCNLINFLIFATALLIVHGSCYVLGSNIYTFLMPIRNWRSRWLMTNMKIIKNHNFLSLAFFSFLLICETIKFDLNPYLLLHHLFVLKSVAGCINAF